MPRDVVLHGALLEGTGTQMDKPLALFAYGAVMILDSARKTRNMARRVPK